MQLRHEQECCPHGPHALMVSPSRKNRRIKKILINEIKQVLQSLSNKNLGVLYKFPPPLVFCSPDDDDSGKKCKNAKKKKSGAGF